MNRIALIISLLIKFHFSFSQGYNYVGARSNSMANASVAFVDGWAYHHNPGALGDLKKAEVGISYENRFLLKDLQSQGLVYSQPIKKGVISFGAQLFGLNTYRTYRLGGGYSLKLSEKLFAGVQLNYQNIHFSSNYGSRSSVTAEAGIYVKLTNEWKIGVSVFNLGRTKLNSFENERFTTLMRLGSVYQLSKNVLFALEAEKNMNYQLRLKGAVEYKPIKNFFLRGGLATQPIEFTFGCGYKFKAIQIDLGSAFHQLIGWSPHFSLTYSFDKPN